MKQNKTQPTTQSVEEYLETITDAKRKHDCQILLKIMAEISKEKAMMWGSSIVGFGKYHYVYASGREGDWMRIGFSSRKNEISLYLTCGLDRAKKLLEHLGAYRRGVGCLYIKRLSDVDLDVLRQLIRFAIEHKEFKP